MATDEGKAAPQYSPEEVNAWFDAEIAQAESLLPKYPLKVVDDLRATILIMLQERLKAAGMEAEYEMMTHFSVLDDYLTAWQVQDPDMARVANRGSWASMAVELPDSVAFMLRLMADDGRLLVL